MLKLGNVNINKAYLGSTEIKKMYLGGNIVFDNSVPSFLPQTQAILDRADLEGFTKPIPSTITAMNTLIAKMLDNGTWWSGLDVQFNFAYNDLNCTNFSRINWKNPSLSLATVIGGMSYTVNGFLGNGIDSKIDTNYNPFTNGINYLLNNAGRGAVQFYDTNSSVQYKIIDCALDVNNINNMYSMDRSAHRINSSSTPLPTSFDMSGIGYKGIVRNSNTSINLTNKSVSANMSVNSTSIHNSNQVLLARSDFSSDIGVSFYHIGASLSNLTMQQFRTDYNEYLTEIGLTAFA